MSNFCKIICSPFACCHSNYLITFRIFDIATTSLYNICINLNTMYYIIVLGRFRFYLGIDELE